MAEGKPEKPAKAAKTAKGPKRSHKTRSGIEIKPLYGPEDIKELDPARDLGQPGEYPFTRGIYSTMYRTKLWTMRQYAGFGTAAETNTRFKYLLEQGQTGLSVALDLPTQLGYDSDAAEAAGEVGKVGVAIDSLADMERIFEGIPIGEVTTSFTINATAPILLAMYEAVAERQGVARERISGTTQNDLLKEFGSRGAWVFPIQPSMKLVVDVIEYAAEHLPRWNPISIASHYRDAGATPAEELAYTLADGIAYVRACIERGLPVDRFAPRLSFFFYTYTNFFEEIAKYRAGRRIWAKTLRETFGAKDPDSWRLRAACVCGGHSLTRAEPLNNIARGTIETMAVAIAGLQSVFTAAYDEAYAIPTELSARTALRVQQIVAYETDIADTADPLAGSYFVEALTDQMEAAVRRLLDDIEARGGMVRCLERGDIQSAISRRAYEHQKNLDSGETPVVGVSAFKLTTEPVEDVQLSRVNRKLEQAQIDSLKKLRASRDAAAVAASLAAVEAAARADKNVMPAVGIAVRAYATIGEITNALRRVYGEYVPPTSL